MKKLIVLISVLICSLSICFAGDLNENEKAVLERLKETHTTVDGRDLHLPTRYINQTENQMLKIDMTDAEKATIMAAIDKAWAVVEATDTTKIGYVDKKSEYIGFIAEADKEWGIPVATEQDKIKDIAHSDMVYSLVELIQECGKLYGYTITYKADGMVLTIYDKNGNVAGDTENPIQQTGFDATNIIVIAGVVVVLFGSAMVFAVASRKKSR